MYEVSINGVVVPATINKIVFKLNDENTAEFTIDNNAENRDLVSGLNEVTIRLLDKTIFTGIVASPELYHDVIKCYCREKAVFYLERKKGFTNVYEVVPADTILDDICTAAGVTYAGNAPNALSIQFDNSSCYYAALLTVLHYGAEEVAAAALGLGEAQIGTFSLGGSPEQYLDWWTSDTTFYVGYKGTSKGSVPLLTVGRKRLDFTKMKDKVTGTAWTRNGTEITYTAGTGTREETFTDRNAIGQTTLGNLVERRYAMLNQPIVSLPVTIDILTWVEYDLSEGDYITVEKEELGVSGEYRIAKAELSETTVKCDLVRSEVMPEELFRSILGMDAQPAPAPTNLPPVEERFLDALTEVSPGLVVAVTDHSEINIKCTAYSWTTVGSVTIPDEEHEILYVHVCFAFYSSSVNHYGTFLVRAKVGGAYYPSANGVTMALVVSTEPLQFTPATVLIPIPRNCANQTVEVEVYSPLYDTNAYVFLDLWGHSPHAHPAEVNPSYHYHNINEARHFNTVTDNRQTLLEMFQ